jgi:hypothetical protein
MPLDTRTRVRAGSEAALDLPPPFRAIALREVGDALLTRRRSRPARVLEHWSTSAASILPS